MDTTLTKLWTTPAYDALDWDALIAINAGCGPSKCSACHKLLGNVVGLSVFEACAQHDVDYREGGSEFDRLTADVRFIANLLLLALATGEKRNTIRVPVLLGYFFVVRYAGRQHFKYTQ